MDGIEQIIMMVTNLGVAATIAIYAVYHIFNKEYEALKEVAAQLKEISRQQAKIIEKLDRIIDRVESK